MPKKVVEPIKEEVPERVWGVKKTKVVKMFEPVEIKEPIDWQALSFQMTFLEYQELRKQHGLE